jgi:ABC-type uncharacterized transport system ATPase subunit
VFLTSHDPTDIERLCRRAVVIDNGSIILDTTVEKLKSGNDDAMEDIMARIFKDGA